MKATVLCFTVLFADLSGFNGFSEGTGAGEFIVTFPEEVLNPNPQPEP